MLCLIDHWVGDEKWLMIEKWSQPEDVQEYLGVGRETDAMDIKRNACIQSRQAGNQTI